MPQENLVNRLINNGCEWRDRESFPPSLLIVKLVSSVNVLSANLVFSFILSLILSGCSFIPYLGVLDSGTPASLKSDESSTSSIAAGVSIEADSANKRDGAADQPDHVIKSPSSPDSPVPVDSIILTRNLQKIQRPGAPVSFLSPAASPGAYVSAEESGRVILWKNTAEAYELLRFPERIALFGFNPDTWTAAGVTRNGVIYVYSLAGNEEPFSKKDLKIQVVSIDLSPDGRSLLIGGSDSRVYRWRFYKERESTSRQEQEKAFERYVIHGSVVSAVRFHPLGRIFFSGDWLGHVHVSLLFDADRFGGKYDKNLFEGQAFSEGEITQKSADRPSRGPVAFLRCSPDGRYVLLGDETGSVELWQVRAMKMRASMQAHRGTIIDLAVSPDSVLVASLGRDGRLVVQSMKKEKTDSYKLTPFQQIEVPAARKIAFLGPEDLAVGYADGHIQVIHVQQEIKKEEPASGE